MGESVEVVRLVCPHHQSTLKEGVWDFFRHSCKVDLELHCNGHRIKAHKLVLSIFSSAINDMLEKLQRGKMVLNLDELALEARDLDLVIEFMYCGQVDLNVDRMDSLQKVADALGVVELRQAIDKLRNGRTDKQSDEKDGKEEGRGGEEGSGIEDGTVMVETVMPDLESVQQYDSEVVIESAAAPCEDVKPEKADGDVKPEKVDGDVKPEKVDGDVKPEKVDCKEETCSEKPNEPGKCKNIKGRRKPDSGRRKRCVNSKMSEGESKEPLSSPPKRSRSEYKKKWDMNRPLLKCTFCDYSTRCKVTYKSHIAKHDPMADRFLCHICSKVLRSQRAVEGHMRLHGDPGKLYQCPHCIVRTPHRSNYRLHMADVHKEDMEGKPLAPEYQCPNCEFRCFSKYRLRYHVTRKHVLEKSYKCQQCSYAAVSKCEVDKHVRYTHTQERPFSCEVCNHKSKTRSAWKSHQQSHSGVKPYQCDTCGKLYARSDKLKHHVSTKHTEKADNDNDNDNDNDDDDESEGSESED